ncbi:hypothetical protein J2T02_003966 [Chitinophaga terrae (ex Kim and Jung 2007)]|uniref:6-bladed beta-propeller n=1 Tax=Chitinophaga terrae (ex Kim and Jung 2007) TaxID=408074 RepID=UPI002787C031|nr:6-bladed beta-propeller [Chitinophaga terrae (ex Kim and Jung 2007)]MDQ0108826.1 hypothetical protein [Chitinophaga terrae (ex Kim and Jung 2007)]
MSLLANEVAISQQTVERKKIMIDPMSATGGAASKYFDDVQYIPLQTTKESLFGRIDQLYVTPEYFIILDKETEAVLFFNKNGDFHHKVNRFKFDRTYRVANNGGMRRSVISSFSIAARGDYFYIKSIFEPNVLYVYSFDGERVGKITLPKYTQDYFQLKNGYFVCKQQRPYSEKRVSEFHPFDISIIKDSLSVPDFYIPVDFKYAALLDDLEGHINYFNRGGPDSVCLYSPDFSYILYQFSARGIQKEFEILFPKSLSIPSHFDIDSIYTGRRREILKGKVLINCIWNASLLNDYLLLDLRIPNSGNSIGPVNLLYSLKSGRLISLDKISADIKTTYLPISAGVRSEMLFCNNQYIYFSLPSFLMFAAKEAMKDKQPTYSARMDNYFKNPDRKSNPVLVQLKPKSSL